MASKADLGAGNLCDSSNVLVCTVETPKEGETMGSVQIL